MKKLLSPALNRWFCYALVLLCSTMYAQPCTFEDVVKETTHNVYYEKNYSYAVDILIRMEFYITKYLRQMK